MDPAGKLINRLPKLITSEVPAGYLKADIAQKLGLKKRIVVSSGDGDNMMGAIGTGAVKNGVVTMSLGTFGTLYGYSEIPVTDKSLAGFCSSTNGYLPLLCAMNCTISLDLTRELLNTSIQELEQLLSSTKLGSDGIVTLPFYNGERSPNLPKGKGCILGLNMNNMNKANILLFLHGIGYFRDEVWFRFPKKLGFKPKEIRLTGGGSKSKLWRQMAADILNLPIESFQKHRKLPLLAAPCRLMGLSDKENKYSKNSRRSYSPKKENVKQYEAIYSEYKKYLNALEKLFLSSIVFDHFIRQWFYQHRWFMNKNAEEKLFEKELESLKTEKDKIRKILEAA